MDIKHTTFRLASRDIGIASIKPAPIPDGHPAQLKTHLATASLLGTTWRSSKHETKAKITAGTLYM